MGFVGNLLGMGDNSTGGAGSNFSAQRTNILQPVDLNQTNQLYNQSQQGLSQQQAFINALMGQNGIQNQSNVFNQLQGVANGIGPNPALAQLANTTGQNIASQSALMAGQRGTGANTGLLARQIGQQGAGIQQNAAGQAAALQAQQQLGALGQLGGIAGQQVGQYGNAVSGYNAAAQNEQNQLLNALNQYNNQNVNMQSNINSSNAGVAGQTAKGQQGLLGGAMSGIGSGVASLFGADGGMVPSEGPQSFVGQYLKKMACGGMANGGPIDGEQLAAHGKVVPGKADIKGDSLKNDKVPAMLSPKEIVLPRSITLSKNAPDKAKDFVAAVLARNGMKK